MQKLRLKGFLADDFEPIVQRFIETNLISDHRFTESFIHWRRNRGYGPLRISMDLQARGIPPDMIADLLQITDNAWFVGAQKMWQKHFKGKRPVDYLQRAKQMRFLQYRGFTREQIEYVFKHSLSGSELYDHN